MSQNKGFWGDEDSASEYDQLQEEVQENEQRAEEIDAELVYADEADLDTISNQSAFDLNEEESNIVYNVRLRLEMARLYELLINHNLFEGVDASEQAIQTIQDEMKSYIVERLEVLLGIREKKTKPEQSETDFNPDEADFLKQLAGKGMAMAGRTPSVQTKSTGLNPISRSPVVGKLKTLVSRPKTARVSVTKSTSASKPRRKTVLKKRIVETTMPVKRIRKKKIREHSAQSKIKSGGFGRDLTKDEVETLAVEDLKQTKGKKPFHKMNAKEKAVEVARVNKKHTRKVSPKDRKQPMSVDQQEAMYLQQQNSRISSAPDKMNAFNTILASKIVANKNKGE